MADRAVRRGELARGLELFERARRRLEVAGSPSHLARLHAEQAEAKTLLGMNAQAMQAYEHALSELDRCQLPLEAARARAGMGQLLLRLERRAEAETALAAAAIGFDELGNRSARARVDLIRAELLAANGRGSDARSMALRSLALLEDRPAEACAARHLVARIAADEGDLDLAEQELGAAIRVAQQLDLAPALADLWHTHGVVARRRGRSGAALRRFSRAVEQVERIRGTLQAERFRAAYLGQRSSLFEDLVGTLLDSHQRRNIVERAFAAVERCKSRALLDRLQGAIDLDRRDDVASTANPVERKLQRRLGELRSELNALYSRLGDERSVIRGDRSMTAWKEAIHDKERDLDEVESRLASVRGPADLRAPVVALTSLQEMMDERTLLIEYFTVGDELIARRDLARVGEVDEMLRRLQFQIDRAMRPAAMDGRRGPRLIQDVRRELGALFDALVRPLADRMTGADRLVFAPHGPLHALPFNALFDGQSHLVEHYEITVVPSASLYAHLHHRTPESTPDRDQALVVGVADDVAARISDEADLVAGLLGNQDVRRLIGPDATMGEVLRHAPDHAVIHLACHGRFDPEHPLASGLRLADRWLTTHDVCLMRLNAELVTLSACESGLNVVAAGDELIGLFRALLAAGARSVLASLWRVDDESALAAMQSFYDAWRDRHSWSAASALRRAQLRLMESRPHPAHWAPFTLIGAAS
jgi:tetratricopeptide (TPR) repeat protein